MRTVTFYSYKGGVGRSLLVANTARYLSSLGKSVFTLDLDLEAPGLVYKFDLDKTTNPTPISGILDVLSHFVHKRSLPDIREGYTRDVRHSEHAGPITLMAAGVAPRADYWNTLAKIDWHELLYSENPVAIQFFLEIKEKIKAIFQPDYFLIDARTGITEMGGIATTFLPDSVVCLSLSSAEHLEGMRAVMHGISRTARRHKLTVELLPVISRLHVNKDEDDELKRIAGFLCKSPEEDGDDLRIDDVFVLHAEPLIQEKEQLLVGSKNSPHEVPLLLDYLRLFTRIIPSEEIRPYVGQLVQKAIDRLLDDPDAAQSELEAITAFCADRQAYIALLKLYKLKGVSQEKLLATAATMWRLYRSKETIDQIVMDIVANAYSETRATETLKKFAPMADAIWRLSPARDVRTCLNIANSYLPENREEALRLLSDYVERTDRPFVPALVRLIELSRFEGIIKPLEIIEKFKSNIADPDFVSVWGKVVVQSGDPIGARELLADEAFRGSFVTATSPVTMYRLLKLAEDPRAYDFLREALDKAAANEDMLQLRSLAQAFADEGEIDELQFRLKKWLDPKSVLEIITVIKRRVRRPRALA